VLAADAALAAGAGLVTIFADHDTYPVIAPQRASVMTRPLADGEGVPDLARFSAAVVGPGWGTARARSGMLAEIVSATGRGVIDADGLAVLARGVKVRGSWVLTPHPGELATLLGVSHADVLGGFLDAAVEAAKRYDATVVAKAVTTVVARPNGQMCVVDGMCPHLATAGSGDVLAGTIGALIAAGYESWDAARAGVAAHLAAGRALARSAGFFSSSELPAAVAQELGRIVEL
jgi:NAD(P)H-hydrate epimerase